MAFWKRRNTNSKGLRVIKTVRDMESINTAVQNGYKPLLKKVEASDEIRSKYAIFQNKLTGEIDFVRDFRTEDLEKNNAEFEKVIDWTFYYPYHFKLPFAAYLIPHDIEVGESVFIEDLIEDLVGASWNQGDTYRLDSCEAIWNGTDLNIQYDPNVNRTDFVG